VSARVTRASGAALYVRARQLLAAHRGRGSLDVEGWMAAAREAREYAVSTFPAERRERALRGFVERHCAGRSARVVAVYAVALRLFGELREREGFGRFLDCLEAAAVACGGAVEDLPPPRDPPPAAGERGGRGGERGAGGGGAVGLGFDDPR